jgi:proteasome assembly chaperone (PAC2) family protein
MNVEMYMEPFAVRRVVLTFNGWSDAAMLVQHTMSELARMIPFERAFSWDLDGFWHTESLRPQVNIQHGRIQRVEWPTYRFHLCNQTGSEPVLIGMGPEPSMHWHLFTTQLLDLLEEWGCEEVYLLGSLFDQVFHDEILISGVVQDSQSFNLLRELGCRHVEYSGQGAIHASIMESAKERGFNCLGIWAHLPFYLTGPHELLMARCLRILARLLKMDFDVRRLEEGWHERQKTIEELIQNDLELQQALESMKHDKATRDPGPAKVVRFDSFLKKRRDPSPEE